ncbi:MAG: hypothetical protein HFI33_13585 [Lachnospiraceae bacterium]|nr:hypothetical protein [Lachnospiraceae bacterium]
MKSRVLTALAGISGFFLGVVYMIYRCGYLLKGKSKRADRFFLYFNLLDHWLTLKQDNYHFETYFNKNDIKSVAIYRMGKIGNHLKYELEKVGIEIKYIIDEGEDAVYEGEIHCVMRDKLPPVDAVIVTSIDEFKEIKNRVLKNNKNLQVISLKEILDFFDGGKANEKNSDMGSRKDR